MRRTCRLSFLSAAVLAALAGGAQAEVVVTALPTALTTSPNPGGGCCDGTGVWFNPLTGYAESRGYFFPSTLFDDGLFFLLTDTYYGDPQAQIFTQGFFSRGNGVIYASASNLNPARFGEGAIIGPAAGYQSPGAGYPDLGPLYGNWSEGGRGFIGLTIRNPAGASSADVFYGYADITIGKDYEITLNAFAYENVVGQAITTPVAAAIPEPASWALFGLGALGLAGWARARRR